MTWVFGLLSVWEASAFAPLSLTHSARIVDPTGEPVNGATAVTVTLYDAQTNTDLWRRTYATTAESGYVSVVLEGNDDTNRALTTEVFSRAGVDVGVAVGGSELSPRTRLHSVPYALVAGNVVAANDGSERARAGRTCKTLLDAGYTRDGLYWIDPDNDGNTVDAFQTWCDQTGGGWTLVMQNNRDVPTKQYTTWAQAVSGVVVSGGLSESLGSFDLWVGAAYWAEIGTRARQTWGNTPGVATRTATYASLTMNASDKYSLALSVPVMVGTSTQPGLFSHRGQTLDTFDNEDPGSTCGAQYRAPWWYESCWSGNFWGGANYSSHDPGAHWTSSTSDWAHWGAIWLR